MKTCPTCKLKKTRWASVNGFMIGKKVYCCIGCGFSGCICLPKPNRRKAPTPPSAALK